MLYLDFFFFLRNFIHKPEVIQENLIWLDLNRPRSKYIVNLMKRQHHVSSVFN